MSAWRTSAGATGFRALACVLLAGVAVPLAVAQSHSWEMLPLIPDRSNHRIKGILFLPAVGTGAQDPAQDAIIALHNTGTILYNPGENNGEWGDWRMLCRACGTDYGVRTESGTLIVSTLTGRMHRSVDRGQTWETDLQYGETGEPLFQTRLPAYTDSTGNGRVIGGQGGLIYSDHDGRRGTWRVVSNTHGDPLAFADVPPSPAHPPGRLLAGTWSGLSYSDDGGLTWARATTPGPAGRWIGLSLAFLPEPGHPYGGPMIAATDDLVHYPGPGRAVLLRSDDGGLSWTILHRFDDDAIDLPTGELGIISTRILATPDGNLWAGLNGGALNDPWPTQAGRLLRSTDGGQTWTHQNSTWMTVPGTPYPYAVLSMALSRTGALYVGTSRGLWRSTSPVVASEPSVPASSGLSLSVSPNPSRGAVTLALSSPMPMVAEVSVVDAAGRQVAWAEAWASPVAPPLTLSTRGWAVGVYVARLRVGHESASARFTVVR